MLQVSGMLDSAGSTRGQTRLILWKYIAQLCIYANWVIPCSEEVFSMVILRVVLKNVFPVLSLLKSGDCQKLVRQYSDKNADLFGAFITFRLLIWYAACPSKSSVYSMITPSTSLYSLPVFAVQRAVTRMVLGLGNMILSPLAAHRDFVSKDSTVRLWYFNS